MKKIQKFDMAALYPTLIPAAAVTDRYDFKLMEMFAEQAQIGSKTISSPLRNVIDHRYDTANKEAPFVLVTVSFNRNIRTLHLEHLTEQQMFEYSLPFPSYGKAVAKAIKDYQYSNSAGEVDVF